MARNLGAFSAVLILTVFTVNASAIYFPVPILNVTLPNLGGSSKSLPPLLRLHALQDSEEEIMYATEGTDIFHVRQNELLIGDLPFGNGRQELKISGWSHSGRLASAKVNLVLKDEGLVCEEWKKEMCFWADGSFRIWKQQKPTVVAFLSSEFLLTLCSNYSVAYNVVSGEDYLGVKRMANTNTVAWVLSLLKTPNLAGENITGEILCSVSVDNTAPATYRKHLHVRVIDREELEDSVTGKELEIMSLVVPGIDKISVSYSVSVTVSKYAAFASRVVEPVLKSDDSRRRQMERIVESGVRFRIEPNDAFGVTEEGGIVYVSNPGMLHDATSFSVKITLMYPKGYTEVSSIHVNVSKEFASVCGGRTNEQNWKSCSQKTTESECVKSCGVSTGHLNRTGAAPSTCQWRNNDKPEMLSVQYATCSPDLSTCPDRFCDPLERLFADVCPQDCAVYIFGSANKEKSVPGISSASGVCSCSSEGGKQSCTCDLFNSKKRQNKSRKGQRMEKSSTEPPMPHHSDVNISVVQAANSEQCGMACLSFLVGGTVIFIFAFSTFLMILYHRRLKKRCPNQGPLKEDMININYEDYIDRSAEGLRLQSHNPVLYDKPEYYDKKWEFPRYRLTVENTIGEGEFGKVLKARAEGIGGIDGSTIVAVKTLKENARESELNDLISEYQLLKEVDHPNIIHLLGACTTLDGPLYVIIEYAKFGSLRNYLRRNRQIGSELQLSEKETETSYMQTITPKDILTFAWQIAKGMAYLTEMKLVHRDLAARNVLVAEGLICKISDFGLTRDIYEDDTYLKRSKGRVPVKWMALESLSDHLYTTKSDVWSYGIVLWELVTTGSSPYPGIAVQNLFHLLKSGYRMEKPVNCSTELYQILRSCWHENPSHRPTFKCLVSKLEEMLEEGKDYLDLNPRIIENRTYFTDFPSEEEDTFLPGGEGRRGLRWRFEFNEEQICECTQGECVCRRVLPVQTKPRYENEGVEEASYLQPRGEPKPVNSVLLSGNLCYEESEKRTYEWKKI